MNADEAIVGGGRFTTDSDGYAQLLRSVRPVAGSGVGDRGCNGIGRHIANRLLADGERVVDCRRSCPRGRGCPPGQGRKTDAADAHSLALVGTWMAGLRPVVADEQLAVLRRLVDRRRSLGEEPTRKIAQLHALLLELVPGGAKPLPVRGAGRDHPGRRAPA